MAWLQDKKKGEYGETLVEKFFKERGNKVINVSDNKWYWKEDVDLLIYDNETEYKFEVKTDYSVNATGNIVLEISKDVDGSDGWFNFTKATHLVFVDPNKGVGYTFRYKDLKDTVIGEMERGALGEDVSDRITPKHLNGYFCLLFNLDAHKDLFQTIVL